MVKIFAGTDQEFYMDNLLKSNTDIAKAVIKKDWDMIFACDGGEGSGKSVFVMQWAIYCNPALTINNLAFNPNEFRKAIINAKKYDAIIYDEAFTGLSSRATMSLINRTLVSMLAEIRQKNLFVFVIMPTFFDLDKYVALWRSRALVHIYTGENWERGYFAFYNIDRKKRLYIMGKKYYSYSQPKPNFTGRFTNHYPIDEKEYRRRKLKSLTEREKRREEIEKRREIEGMLFERIMLLDEKVPHSLKMEILRLPASTYYLRLKQWRDQEKLAYSI